MLDSVSGIPEVSGESMLALGLAIGSALCFGVGLVTARGGLRSLDTRAGAAISVPSAAIMFLAVAPLAIDFAELRGLAVLLFAAVGLFFPAVVTLVTFSGQRVARPDDHRCGYLQCAGGAGFDGSGLHE